MPIRINLLAEAQAAEEMRRRDPVKFGIWIGGFLVCLFLLWAGKLQLDLLFANAACKRLESNWTRIEPRFKQVTTNQTRTVLLEDRLARLDRLSTNRFFWGSLLNSLQTNMVDGVELTRIRGDQTYRQIEGAPAKLVAGKMAPRKLASSAERIVLTLDAKDWDFESQTYNKYKQSLSRSGYFVQHVGQDSFVLGNTLGAPVTDPADLRGRQFVPFTLTCSFPEVRRDE